MKSDVTWMQLHQIPEVMEIERMCFDHPWSEEDLRQTLTKEQAHVGRVVSLGRKIVGFVIYELGQHELTILNLAVHPAYQRFGYGQQLIESSVQAMVRQGRDRIVATVSERNLAAQLFLRKMGFECVDILPDYYDSNGESLNWYMFAYPRVESAVSEKFSDQRNSGKRLLTTGTSVDKKLDQWNPENRIAAYFDPKRKETE